MNDTTGSTGPHPGDPDRPDAGAYDAEAAAGEAFAAVRPQEVRALLAAYREAARQAGDLAGALASVGLAGEVLEVSAGVSVDGRPLVRAVLTVAGALRLAAFLDAGGTPPPGLRMHAGPPPWAA